MTTAELSTEQEVNALHHAMTFVMACCEHDGCDAYEQIEEAYVGHLSGLLREGGDVLLEQKALWRAFTRIGSALALEAAVLGADDRAALLDRTYRTLATASVEREG